MWHRTAEITASQGAVGIRHRTIAGPECRLRAALVLWNDPALPERADARAEIVGLAWEGQDSAILWGWPDESGRVELRPGPDCPEVCVVLPPALSLALALRRSGVQLGARVLVIGTGFLGRIAHTVAAMAGGRIVVVERAGSEAAAADPRPDVVIETTGHPSSLKWGTERCGDWGLVFAMRGALASGRHDYYPHVHRRALTVIQVPDRPVPGPGEEDFVERCAAPLAEALRDVRPAEETWLSALVLPEGTTSRFSCERSGWGLLSVQQP